MFDLRQLRYFIAVAEELSFTRAAQRLHISQPPLSQQIQALEQEFGVRLLQRDRRNVSLTAPGRVLLSQARLILGQAEQARRMVADAAAGFSGQLRLAYTVSASFHPTLPKALLQHAGHAPRVRVEMSELNTHQQYPALLANQIDVGFLRGAPPPGVPPRAFRVEVLDREPLLLAVPGRHPLAEQAVVQMHQLAGQPFVAQPRELAATFHDRLIGMASRAGFFPQIRQQAQQINGVLALVAAGMGVALVPASCLAVRLEGVSYLDIDDEDAWLPLAVACRHDDDSPALAEFLALVRDLVVDTEVLKAQAEDL